MSGQSLRKKEIPGWITGIMISCTMLTIVALEQRRPLRKNPRESRMRRDIRNLTLAALSGLAISLLEKPLVTSATRWVEDRRWGLLKVFKLPAWIEVPAAVVLLDYTLYVWHYLTHKVPWLWRMHEVHHVDIDMDTTTAIRFHFAEMVTSIPWRLAQILLIGVCPLSLSTWQTSTIMAILFHHSNIRLPLALERRLNRWIVTPRMHGIHHSIIQKETDSNWSTIFSFPDRVHGTIRLNVPQDEITIGVQAYQKPQELGILRLIAKPFRRQRPSWQLGQHQVLDRAHLPGSRRTLAS